MKYTLGSAALALLLLGAGAANAAVVGTFGNNPPSSAGFFGNDPLGANVGGVFNDYWTFSLTGTSFVTIVNATNTFADGIIGGTNYISNFAGAIFETVGVPGGGDDNLLFGPQFAALNPGGKSQSLNGSGILGPGSYYLQIAGNAGTQAGYGGNFSVSAVPIPAALPLFGTALGGLFMLGRKHRARRASATSVA